MQHYQDSVQSISLVDQKVGSATPAVHIKEPGHPVSWLDDQPRHRKLPLCTVHEKVAVGLIFKMYSIIIIVIILLTFLSRYIITHT